MAVACSGQDGGEEPAANPEVQVGAPDAGPGDGGGGGDAGTPDAGPPANAAGPWPTDAVLDYSSRYGFGYVQSASIDDGYNIWLLDGERIGVLRPGATKPVWTSNIGQAAPGFGQDKLAIDSTVICGGEANRAYVGYRTYDLPLPHREDVNDPELLKGDMDVVQVNADGTVSLVEHLSQSVGTSQPWPRLAIGIHNTNDWHYDEDRSVLTCQKVMRGRDRGELYIGTNHGVTRIRGLVYNSHRHPIWMKDSNGDGVGETHMIGYSYGLGIGQDGAVLIANEWNVGIIEPTAELLHWDNEDGVTQPWALNTHNQELNSLEEFDLWRGFQQTVDGKYYVGSSQYGLWELIRTQWKASANWAKVSGLPTEKINALQATDDGSLYIGTDDAGLWRMGADRQFTRVSGVDGLRVRQLAYDPTVTPSMLLVVTNRGLTVLRGP